MFDKKTVLVTGCSSGFGLLASVSLAKSGFYVFASMRNLAKGKVLEKIIKQDPERDQMDIEIIQLDVCQPASIKNALNKIKKKTKKIDVLVNNAGVGLGGFFEDTSLKDFETLFKTNVFGLVSVTKKVIPMMRESKGGHIINISSIAGRLANPAMSAYAASKYAVEAISQSLYYEVRPFGIKVVLIEPGSFKTEIFAKNLQMAEDSSNKQSVYHDTSSFLLKLSQKRVMKWGGNPQKVADLIVRVAKDKHPRLRYPIGKDIKAMLLLRKLFSNKLIDYLTVKVMQRFYKKTMGIIFLNYLPK